jgi:hypothetical protein
MTPTYDTIILNDLYVDNSDSIWQCVELWDNHRYRCKLKLIHYNNYIPIYPHWAKPHLGQVCIFNKNLQVYGMEYIHIVKRYVSIKDKVKML